MLRPPRTVIGFALINGFTFAVDLGIVSVLHGGLRHPLPVAVTAGYSVAFALAFVLNRRLNFHSRAPVRGELIRYAAVILVNFGVILLGVTTGLEALGVPYQLARVAAGACEAVFMYSAMRWFVFRPDPTGRAALVVSAPSGSEVHGGPTENQQ